MAAARTHLRRGGGIGLDVAASGITVLDFDEPGALGEMATELGFIVPPAVTSPSGGWHVYVAAVKGMPAVIEWRGRRVGEVIRGPRQHVVLPPSPYPGSEKRGVPPGGYYTWTGGIDPIQPPYELPPDWKRYLLNTLPDWIVPTQDHGQPKAEEWEGPSPEELLAKAAQQPYAKRRAMGIKFQCPRCAADGHDRHRDNAVVFNNGRWACAYAPGDQDHKNAIGLLLGFQHGVSEEFANQQISDDVAREIRQRLGL